MKERSETEALGHPPPVMDRDEALQYFIKAMHGFVEAGLAQLEPKATEAARELLEAGKADVRLSINLKPFLAVLYLRGTDNTSVVELFRVQVDEAAGALH